MTFKNLTTPAVLLQKKLPQNIDCNFTSKKLIEFTRGEIRFDGDCFNVEYNTSLGETAIISFYSSGYVIVTLPTELISANMLRALNYKLQDSVCRIWAEDIYPEIKLADDNMNSYRLENISTTINLMYHDLNEISSKVIRISDQVNRILKYSPNNIFRKIRKKLE